MYSYKDRMKAVKLYIKYDQSAADTVRELGYPSNRALTLWYKEYLETGGLHNESDQNRKYKPEQIRIAVDYYFEHGRSISRTIKKIGYPTRHTLILWVDELSPGKRKVSVKQGGMVQFSQEQKLDAVIELCAKEGAATAASKSKGVSRSSVYKWKKELLGEEGITIMKRSGKAPLPDNKDELLAQFESLKTEIYNAQMELDILKKAAEIVKKDQGIDLKKLTNKEKSKLIDALRNKYPLNELLYMVNISKSSYSYQRDTQNRPDKYMDLREKVKYIFNENKNRYGYRRLHGVVVGLGLSVSEKVIRRIMKEEKLVVPYVKKRKYNSYKGEITPAVENVIARDFNADAPNKKWLTDLTEFHIPAGKVYLSPLLDCFEGMLVSWTIGTSPDAELVNTMLDDGISTLNSEEHPIVHNDRGCHYRWPGWIARMESAGLTRSMSKKGCSPDNSACEGFFGRLKNEMFYHRNWKDVSLEQFINELNAYLRWYNEKRIKMSLGAMSPLDYRRSIGFAV